MAHPTFAQEPYALKPHPPIAVFLQELTSTEVADLIASSKVTTAIIASGGTEQNGEHITLGRHNQVVGYTAQRIAEELGDALIAPLIAYVPEGQITPPSGHMLYAGTLSVRESTFEALLEDTARSLKQSGFREIYFIGDSGGNQSAQEKVANQLQLEWQQNGTRIASLSDYYMNNKQAKMMSGLFASIGEPTAHAGIVNVAEVLAARGAAGLRRGALEPYRELFKEQDDVQMQASLTSLGHELLALKVNAALAQIMKLREQANY